MLAVGAKRPLKIGAVVTLASISRISIPQPEDQAEWRRNGECFIHNSRTNQQMPLGVGLLDELIDRPNRIEESVRQLDLPLLIVHGDNDETVPLDAAEELSAWATHSSKVIIKGGSHTFGAKHPFTGPSNELQRVVQEIVAFLGKQFFD